MDNEIKTQNPSSLFQPSRCPSQVLDLLSFYFFMFYDLLMKLHLCKLVKTQLCKLSSLSRPRKRSMLHVAINPFDNHESCMIFAKQLVLTLPFTSITQLFTFDMFYSKLAYNPHGYSISELLSTI